MEIYQIGSTLVSESTANDLDLLIISDKPVDICLYTPEQWQRFKDSGHSDEGHRVVMHPSKLKDNGKSLQKLKLL